MPLCVIQPFRLSKNGDLETAEKTKLINSRIEQVIMTRGTGEGNVGEVPWDADQGTLLYLLRHQNLGVDALRDLAVHYTKSRLISYLPEISVKSIMAEVKKSPSGNTLYLMITWSYNELTGEAKLELQNV